MSRQQPSHRTKSQASAANIKRAVVGNTSGTVPPAWRPNVALHRPANFDRRQGYGTHAATPEKRRDIPKPVVGSKILMSQLPPDTVHERDIEVSALPSADES